KRNLLISSVVLVIGIGGMVLDLKYGSHSLQISPVAIATILGIVLNLVLPQED
ncbi:MAG: uracil permease, partial [Lactococcus sp.]